MAHGGTGASPFPGNEPAIQELYDQKRPVLKTNAITVSFDKASGAIEYRDIRGNIFLHEQAGSRRMSPDTVMGRRCYAAEHKVSNRHPMSIYSGSGSSRMEISTCGISADN